MRNLFLPVVILFTVDAQPANQNIDRVLYFKHIESIQDLREAVTVVRSITQIAKATLDATQKTLTLTAPAGQAATAEWLFNQLDQLVKPEAAAAEFTTDSGDLVRVFYFAQPLTNQELQEVATVVRSTGELRRLFVYSPSRAMVVRGSAADLRLAAWLFKEFDQPSNRPGFAPRVNEYRLFENEDDILQVFYLARTKTVQRLQGIATEVRTTIQIPRLFTSNLHRAIVVRGTAAQLARAAQLIEQSDR